MSPEDRRKKLQELRLELMKLRAKQRTGTLGNPARIRMLRRLIARILTIEREEQLNIRRGSEKSA
ncbi:50S ribosomal protein L29 [archaeon]|mgnify:CR=1 FL=1|nr:50S ribosomal protein L29 [archaeon]